jgi:endonuclease YncB( thermonuclease family)
LTLRETGTIFGGYLTTHVRLNLTALERLERQNIASQLSPSGRNLISPTQMRTSLLLALACLIAAIPSEVVAQHAPSAQPFQQLDGCTYKPQRWNDGDSFHVILADAKELIFRLYFVDTSEEERVYADRIAEQAAYFGITPSAAIEAGHLGERLRKGCARKPFTIQTRWRLARGRSKLPRYYAIVTAAEGRDLAELLVSAGLARIYGTRTPLPDGRDSRAYLAHLAELEAEAKAAKRGAWC